MLTIGEMYYKINHLTNEEKKFIERTATEIANTIQHILGKNRNIFINKLKNDEQFIGKCLFEMYKDK